MYIEVLFESFVTIFLAIVSKVLCAGQPLYARGFARRDVCLRWTLGCHAPFRAVKKNKKPTPPEPALPTPESSTSTVSHPISSPGASVFYSKYQPTPVPPRLYLLTSKAPPALNHFTVQERYTATFACLDTESYSSNNTYKFSQWPTPPLPQQHKAPSPPLPPTAM